MQQRSNNPSRVALPRLLAPADFATLGVEDIAFVKPVVVNGAHAYAIHAANGQHLAVVPNRDLALATVRENDLEPVSVH
ncbi:MAG: DUF1150 family protein [Rhodospirillales bacterium]|nr:DUF1150 family protein [Rhodospirillales bacterium]